MVPSRTILVGQTPPRVVPSFGQFDMQGEVGGRKHFDDNERPQVHGVQDSRRVPYVFGEVFPRCSPGRRPCSAPVVELGTLGAALSIAMLL